MPSYLPVRADEPDIDDPIGIIDPHHNAILVATSDLRKAEPSGASQRPVYRSPVSQTPSRGPSLAAMKPRGGGMPGLIQPVPPVSCGSKRVRWLLTKCLRWLPLPLLAPIREAPSVIDRPTNEARITSEANNLASTSLILQCSPSRAEFFQHTILEIEVREAAVRRARCEWSYNAGIGIAGLNSVVGAERGVDRHLDN